MGEYTKKKTFNLLRHFNCKTAKRKKSFFESFFASSSRRRMHRSGTSLVIASMAPELLSRKTRREFNEHYKRCEISYKTPALLMNFVGETVSFVNVFSGSLFGYESKLCLAAQRGEVRAPFTSSHSSPHLKARILTSKFRCKKSSSSARLKDVDSVNQRKCS
jgi:hypothetical protein